MARRAPQISVLARDRNADYEGATMYIQSEIQAGNR